MKYFLSLPGRFVSITLLILPLLACEKGAWNNPYPDSDKGKNILYSSFAERPKHLDPVKSYSSNEYAFIGQIYEPPLQYHYLKRPFQLIPQTAVKIPEPRFFSKEGKRLPQDVDSNQIAYSIYEIQIKAGIQYQPHPAFARNEQGKLLYHNLKESDLLEIHKLSDFKKTGTRELVAKDYVYQIKRLAHPGLHSPIFSLMAEYIVGLKQYAVNLKKVRDQRNENGLSKYLDLHEYPLEGVKEIDRYTYQIKVKGKYPQLLYWLAMPFFAPMPHEADYFYSQPGMKERNISLDWYPVGTGAYMLKENNPNRKMVLERNPNYREDLYPSDGSKKDREKGLLADAGKPMPFIDKVVYSLEKETIPYWNKFLQGYYDVSGVSSDSFDQAIQFGAQGEVGLTEVMKEKGIRLLTEVQATSSYMGFNMLDPIVGGNSSRARKIRQAISIAVDYEDFISIFRNGRGIAAQGPLPPGIFGFRSGKAGMNPVVYNWVNKKRKRKPIEEARRLLAEAGYPNGRDRKTGKPLLIHLDITGGGADDKALWDWLRKQLKKIDLELIIRNTDYNRFQEKMRKGNAQLYMWGWNADYPDPENFLFLLYGPNGKVKHHGENASNYRNPEFDRLFEQMKNMDNSPERQAIIDKMVRILRHDAPWLWGFHPKSFVLHHAWYKNAKPNQMAHNSLKYKRVDAASRDESREKWNRPILWPVWLLLVILLVSIIPAVVTYMRSERKSAMMH